MRLECYTAAGQTLVPNVFIDKYMAEANGEFVKVYLCLLRMQGEAEFSAEKLAERLDISERTVGRALKYLEGCGLLKLFYDSEGRMNGIRMLPGSEAGGEVVMLAGEGAAPDTAAQQTPAKSEPASAAKPARQKAGRRAEAPEERKEDPLPASPESEERPHYRPTDVARLCEEDGEFNLLVTAVVPAYLDRSMTHRDNEIFAWLHHDMKMPVDVLEYCVEQCVERKKEDKAKPQFMRYIETVALSWYKEGVKDLEGAREAVRRFDEKVRQQKEGAARVQGDGEPAEGEAGKRRKTGPGRSAKIQAAYGFSTERSRGEVDYNALAWSRMWEEK